MSLTDLDQLSRKELQSLCKERGIKANSKTLVLLRQLKELLAGSDDAPSPSAPADAEQPDQPALPTQPAPVSAKRKPKAAKVRAEPTRPSKRSKKQQPAPCSEDPEEPSRLAPWCVVHNKVAASCKDGDRYGTILMVGGACFVGGLPFLLTGSGVAPPGGYEDNQLCPSCVTANEEANAAPAAVVEDAVEEDAMAMDATSSRPDADTPALSRPAAATVVGTDIIGRLAEEAMAMSDVLFSENGGSCTTPDCSIPIPIPTPTSIPAAKPEPKTVAVGCSTASRPSPGTRMQNYRAKMAGIGLTSDSSEPRASVSDAALKHVPDPTLRSIKTPQTGPVDRNVQLKLGAPTPFRGGLLNRGVPEELISGFGARMARTPPKPVPMATALQAAMGRSTPRNAPSSVKVTPVSSSVLPGTETASLRYHTLHAEQVAAFKPTIGLARTPPPTFG